MLLLNDQAGGFPSATEILGPVGAGYVQPRDFNGDGIIDLAVVGLGNGFAMRVLYGDGTGAFPSQESFLVGINQNSISIADLNGDLRAGHRRIESGGQQRLRAAQRLLR